MTGLGTMHPESEDMAGDMEHLLSLGLKGVKLHPDIQGFCLDDPRNREIYRLCSEAGIPVLLHTGDTRYDYSNPNRLIPMLKAYPDLLFIGAHFGGWSLWEEAPALLCSYPNFVVDCSSSLYQLTPEKAAELIRTYGAERVLFGTDYPMWRPVDEVERFYKIPLTEEERDLVLWKNAERIFGLSAAKKSEKSEKCS
jgi:predicted TIM-barrel fold metal-dependent hydrolase